MPLRIAFDLDGVLADMEGRLAREAERLFPPDTSASDAVIASQRPIKPGQPNSLWRRLQTIENFWEQLDEAEPGGIARLAAVAEERRWEIIFLTSRPDSAGATAQVQTQRWLQSHGFTLPSVYVVQGSRGRIASALGLDVVVDDSPANCLDVVTDSRARAMLVWRYETRPPASTERYGIDVVHSVAECLDELSMVGDRVTKRSVIDRVRRFLVRNHTREPKPRPIDRG